MPAWAKVLIVLGGSVVVLTVVAVVVGLIDVTRTTDAVESVSNQFVADIQANRPAAAYRLAGPLFRSANSRQQLAEVAAKVAPLLRGKAVVTDRSIGTDVGGMSEAFVSYTVGGSHHVRYAAVILLDDHSWQVLTFRYGDFSLTATDPSVGSQSLTAAEQVSGMFLSDFQSDRPGPAYALFSPDLSRTESPTKFTSFVTTTFRASQGAPAIHAAAVDKNVPVLAAVVYAVHASYGVYYFKVVLVYGATWQVENYQTSLTALGTSIALPSPK
jgi:hypothetical protein